MIVCFFARFSHVATIPLEDRKAVTTDCYVYRCLPKIFQACCKLRSRTGACGILLHHDNASAHTAVVTPDFLATSDVQLVTHPPYSLNLALRGCFFVPFRQKTAEGEAVSEHRRCPSILRGRHFLHTPVNVVGCHRQLVWEDGQMCTGWGEFLRKTGIDRVAVVLMTNQIATHYGWPSYTSCHNISHTQSRNYSAGCSENTGLFVFYDINITITFARILCLWQYKRWKTVTQGPIHYTWYVEVQVSYYTQWLMQLKKVRSVIFSLRTPKIDLRVYTGSPRSDWRLVWELWRREFKVSSNSMKGKLDTSWDSSVCVCLHGGGGRGGGRCVV